jgi:hypothetical protein
MTAFEVTTWDEVLAFFCPDGVLEGLWGWLEILRQANDGDIAMYGTFPEREGDGTSISAPGNMGFFRRDDTGHIMVGGMAHSEFAASGRGYIYSLLKEANGVYTSSFETPSTRIHKHARWVQSSPDPYAALSDVASIGLDVVGNIALLNIEIFPFNIIIGGAALAVGFAFDFSAFELGCLHLAAYGVTGSFDSDDVLNIAGVIPEVGMYTDAASALSNLTGWKIEITP